MKAGLRVIFTTIIFSGLAVLLIVAVFVQRSRRR
jgi:hypothetical protein